MHLLVRSADKLFVKTTNRSPFVQCSIYSLHYSISGKNHHNKKDPARIVDKNEILISWTSKISSLVRRNQPAEAIRLFRRMLTSDQRPNFVTAVSVIKAVGDVGLESIAGEINGLVIKIEFEFEIPVITALHDVYSIWDMRTVWKLFGEVCYRDVVLWSAMVSTFGRKATALLQMYGKFGEVVSARTLFNYFHRKDVIAYSAMISAYAQSGDTYNAFDTLTQMQLANEKPTVITFVGLLQASSSLAAEEIGESIQAYATKAGYVSNTYLTSVLIDLYRKCGRIRQAKLLFSETSRKDLICWSSMINGYGKNGYGTEAVETFSKMLRSGIKPNDVVFISILSACSQCGLLSKGWEMFYAMKEKYGITPRLAHYACMVDLLSHSGNIEEGLEFVNNMPIEPDKRIWGALLAGCRKVYGSDVIAEIAAR